MSDAQLTKVPGWGVEASPLRRDGAWAARRADLDEETDVEMIITAREQYRGLGDSTVEHRPTDDAVVVTDGGVDDLPRERRWYSRWGIKPCATLRQAFRKDVTQG